MPSQLAHMVFASDSITRCLPHLAIPTTSPWLGLGAQGPDIFYHNRRRRPSGLEYGALLHRRGYGTAVAALVSFALARKIPVESDFGAYTLAFATHAILDRVIHPFINYFAGWGPPGRTGVNQLPFQLHAYFERVLDVMLVERFRAQRAAEFDVLAALDCGERVPRLLALALQSALTAVTPRAAADTLLPQRLENAYLDAIGFYRITSMIDHKRYEQMLQTEHDLRKVARWISLLHPVELPSGIDSANESHDRWYNPCDLVEYRTESFWDLYEQAGRDVEPVLRRVADLWKSGDRVETLVGIVSDTNLSDGRTIGRPCRKRHNNILPLAEHLESVIARCSAAPFG